MSWSLKPRHMVIVKTMPLFLLCVGGRPGVEAVVRVVLVRLHICLGTTNRSSFINWLQHTHTHTHTHTHAVLPSLLPGPGSISMPYFSDVYRKISSILVKEKNIHDLRHSSL